MGSRKSAGHLAALFTIIIWGTTFISTKILLADFQPVEILFFRFVIGFGALILACPHGMKGMDRRQEKVFALAGLCGICLYYLLENIALTCTLASNVGVIISAAPFFTAILSRLFMKSEGKLGPAFFIGFGVAMAGILMISLNGSGPELNPAGDILALLAAFVWACYSILMRKIGDFGYPVILATRRTFFMGYCLWFRRCLCLTVRSGRRGLRMERLCLISSIWGWGRLPFALLRGILRCMYWGR